MQRAILEVERRFFGNANDHHAFSEQGNDDGKVVWSNREKASAFLDMRLLLKATAMIENEWKESKNLLQDFYVECCATCKSNEVTKLSNVNIYIVRIN